MLFRIVASATLLGGILLFSASFGYAEYISPPHPWPIRHWRNHQPLRSDITPAQARAVRRLYRQREKNDPQLLAPDHEKNHRSSASWSGTKASRQGSPPPQ